MAIQIKSDQEIQAMREGGKILSEVLDTVCRKAAPGVSTYELDQLAENLIISYKAKPGFKGYNGFPATLCTNINNEIVHGIPRRNAILEEGDLFTVDCGVIYKGLYTDAARSVGIGKISPLREKLMKTAYESLSKATDAIIPGENLGKISKIIQNCVENSGFYVINDLTGHGVGRQLHEDPVILNYWDGRPGPLLEPGMTLAIEPIFSAGTSQMKTLSDNWTVVTKDGSDSVQVENTILVTRNGSEILT